MDFKENEKFEKRALLFKRTGLGVAALIIVAAAAGLFGYSIDTKKKALQGSCGVQYENFLRATKETELRVMADNMDSVCSVTFNNNYFEKIKITEVMPWPDKMYSGNGCTTYMFKVNNHEGNEFIFNTKAFMGGEANAYITVDNKSFTINQFIYP